LIHCHVTCRQFNSKTPDGRGQEIINNVYECVNGETDVEANKATSPKFYNENGNRNMADG